MSSANPSDIRLPVELWLQIIDLVKGKRELLALCHTSSILRALVPPHFKTLDLLHYGKRGLSRQEQFSELKVIGAFRQPGLAAMVTRFDIQIVASASLCPRQSPVMPASSCLCDSLEKCVAEALDAMVNLEHLSIHCLLCTRMERHQYFDNVKARRLQSFSCRCSCSGISHSEREKMLLAPVLNTIQSLRWAHSQHNAMHGWSAGSIVDRPDILPHLSGLVHYGKHSDNLLLERRPIQRICVSNLPRHFAHFLRALYTFPGSLTHMILEDLSKVDYIISEVPLCFVNIRHIGTIPAIPNGPEIETFMKPLASLHNLESIDVTVVDGVCPWDAGLLSRLNRTHPKLRKVLIQVDEFCIWEMEQMKWKKRVIPQFSSWDIIKGALDGV